MGKIKVIFFLIVLSFCFNTAKSYEISDLIKILIEKNNTDSAFKYNDLIDDKKLQNADTIYIPQIDYSYSFSNNITSTNSTLIL